MTIGLNRVPPVQTRHGGGCGYSQFSLNLGVSGFGAATWEEIRQIRMAGKAGKARQLIIWQLTGKISLNYSTMEFANY